MIMATEFRSLFHTIHVNSILYMPLEAFGIVELEFIAHKNDTTIFGYWKMFLKYIEKFKNVYKSYITCWC